MTTSKPRPKYDVWKDPLPPLVCIGCSLITHEVDVFEQDGRVVEVPVEDAICYLTVDRELVYTSSGSANYSTIAKLIEEQKGLYRKHYKLVSVWECVPQHIADEIF